MKTLFITGGTGGLGSVVVPRLRREYGCVLLHGDLTKESEAERAVTEALQHGRPYGLVHLVGGFTSDSGSDAWSRMLSLNLLTAVNACRALTPHIEDGGRVIAIGALASLTRPPGLDAYVTSKTALNTFIELFAARLRERRIAVNAILPGTLDEQLRAAVAETIAFLLSEGGGTVTGALIPVGGSL